MDPLSGNPETIIFAQIYKIGNFALVFNANMTELES